MVLLMMAIMLTIVIMAIKMLTKITAKRTLLLTKSNSTTTSPTKSHTCKHNNGTDNRINGAGVEKGCSRCVSDNSCSGNGNGNGDSNTSSNSTTPFTSGCCMFIYKFRPFIYIILHLNIYFYHISGSSFMRMVNAEVMSLESTTAYKRPYFDDGHSKNVTIMADETAVMKCRVKNKGNRTVSWMRKRDLHILTTNIYTYTGDQRFTVLHTPGSDDWDLRIEYAQPRDSGIYECQVNTDPKLNLAILLDVTEMADMKRFHTELPFYDAKAAKAKILGSTEIHVKRDSTIALACSVNIHASSVSWYHGSTVVDFDSLRGGISLETEKTGTGTTSRLMLTRASLRDSGNYTCVPSGALPASVRVHVLTGEQPAAMQTSNAPVLSMMESNNRFVILILSLFITIVFTWSYLIISLQITFSLRSITERCYPSSNQCSSGNSNVQQTKQPKQKQQNINLGLSKIPQTNYSSTIYTFKLYQSQSRINDVISINDTNNTTINQSNDS